MELYVVSSLKCPAPQKVILFGKKVQPEVLGLKLRLSRFQLSDGERQGREIYSVWSHREEEQRKEFCCPFSVKVWALEGILSRTQQFAPIHQLKRQEPVDSGGGDVLDAGKKREEKLSTFAALMRVYITEQEGL